MATKFFKTVDEQEATDLVSFINSDYSYPFKKTRQHTCHMSIGANWYVPLTDADQTQLTAGQLAKCVDYDTMALDIPSDP